MKKRMVLVMMAAVLLLGLLTGCGGKSGSAGGSSSDQQGASESGGATGGSEVFQTKVFRVGMECSYSPFNWTQSDDSNGAVPIEGTSDYAYGYDVEMAKRICEKNG